jgi:hypothetical protein
VQWFLTFFLTTKDTTKDNECVTDFDKLSLVKRGNSFSVLGFFNTVPAASKNEVSFKSGQK